MMGSLAGVVLGRRSLKIVNSNRLRWLVGLMMGRVGLRMGARSRMMGRRRCLRPGWDRRLGRMLGLSGRHTVIAARHIVTSSKIVHI